MPLSVYKQRKIAFPAKMSADLQNFRFFTQSLSLGDDIAAGLAISVEFWMFFKFSDKKLILKVLGACCYDKLCEPVHYG